MIIDIPCALHMWSGADGVCYTLTVDRFASRLTETQLKLDSLDKDPCTLDRLARPLPFRSETLPEHTHTLVQVALSLNEPTLWMATDQHSLPPLHPGERSPYGPSPLGRPASETRAFLSPPTLLDGPPNRLSPRGACTPRQTWLTSFY